MHASSALFWDPVPNPACQNPCFGKRDLDPCTGSLKSAGSMHDARRIFCMICSAQGVPFFWTILSVQISCKMRLFFCDRKIHTLLITNHDFYSFLTKNIKSRYRSTFPSYSETTRSEIRWNRLSKGRARSGWSGSGNPLLEFSYMCARRAQSACHQYTGTGMCILGQFSEFRIQNMHSTLNVYFQSIFRNMHQNMR